MKDKQTATTKDTGGRKVFNIVSTVVTVAVFILLLAVVLVLVIQRTSTNEPKIFGYSFYIIRTDSMTPTIEVDDVILTKEVKNINDLNIGDVITYVIRDHDNPLSGYNNTHRIKEFVVENGVRTQIVTQGDKRGSTPDRPIVFEDVKGVLVANMPFFGGILAFLKTPLGYAMLIALPLLLVLVMQIYGMFKRRAAKTFEENSTSVAATFDMMNKDDKNKLLRDLLEQKKANQIIAHAKLPEDKQLNDVPSDEKGPQENVSFIDKTEVENTEIDNEISTKQDNEYKVDVGEINANTDVAKSVDESADNIGKN